MMLDALPFLLFKIRLEIISQKCADAPRRSIFDIVLAITNCCVIESSVEPFSIIYQPLSMLLLLLSMLLHLEVAVAASVDVDVVIACC